jgi:hypothetical protein
VKPPDDPAKLARERLIADAERIAKDVEAKVNALPGDKFKFTASKDFPGMIDFIREDLGMSSHVARSPAAALQAATGDRISPTLPCTRRVGTSKRGKPASAAAACPRSSMVIIAARLCKMSNCFLSSFTLSGSENK